MLRSRSWFGTNWNRPKNRLSLDHLKYLYSVLERNTTVSESNRSLLVESLRCIAEILIWGDQHDSSVFDFFLEKNMLSYFLNIMRQRSGGSSFVCVQLLQTLNILFENIRNETSLYYLLSNNHVNSIIVHKFDFSDEDVMGYYILFLKTLSLKLNIHTIHFFYNEHTNDFPLYTEAIKFFNHPESMVRIAVRTITLNVYKVQNSSMLQFIRDKTAAPYFSNLVWFIGKHILELDSCVRNDTDHQSQQKLSNLVAEHLDHLHYLNDILLLDIFDLNAVLTEHLLHKLFVPLYIFSLTPAPPLTMAVVTKNLATVLNKVVDIDVQESSNNPRISPVVSLYLLSLVFLVINHGPLVHALAWVLLNADHSVFKNGAAEILNAYVHKRQVVSLGFGQPQESLEQSLETVTRITNTLSIHYQSKELNSGELNENDKINITDEEKEKLKTIKNQTNTANTRPFLDMILSSLDSIENDYLALIGLCLIYALASNTGGSPEWLQEVLKNTTDSSITYKALLLEKLLQIITLASQSGSRVRLITLDIALNLLVYFTNPQTRECSITEAQQTTLFSAKNQSMIILRTFYKSEDIFLDLFENEFNEMLASNLNVEFLCMDANILLHPTGTPLTGINFARRLPCGEVEKARKSIRVFFLLRKACQTFLNEIETLLPLTHLTNCVEIENVLDLNNSDLIGCTVITKDAKHRRFLVIDTLQFMLVEPDSKRLGWGVAKFVGFLQDIEVVGDKEDSRCLHITVNRGGITHNRTPILSAKFIFDDHIRCMAAKQRLIKGRSKARQKKMYQIAQLLEIPIQGVDSVVYNSGDLRLLENHRTLREHRPLFSTANRLPGFAAALRRDSVPNRTVSRMQILSNRSVDRSGDDVRKSRNSNNIQRTSREKNLKISRSRESSSSRSTGENLNILLSEEIPLENLPRSRNGSPSPHCSLTTAPQQPQLEIASNVLFDQEYNSTTEEHIQAEINDIVSEVVTSSEETSFIGAQNEEQFKGAVKNV